MKWPGSLSGIDRTVRGDIPRLAWRSRTAEPEPGAAQRTLYDPVSQPVLPETRQAEAVLRRADLEIPQFLEVDTADTLTISMVVGGLGWSVTTPLCLLQAWETPNGSG